MKDIFDATSALAVWLTTVVKPSCETVMEHPIFKIFAIPATCYAAIRILKAIWDHLNDYQ